MIDNVHTIVFDFDGVFTNNKVIVDQHGNESVICCRSDGLAFDLLRGYIKKFNIECKFFILSTESNSVVKKRAEKLGIDCIFGVKNKLKYMKDFFKKTNIYQNKKNDKKYEGFVFLGNDLNDFPLMLKAGVSVAPSDSHSAIIKIADFVLDAKGGNGFVRLFVEKILGIEHLKKEELNEFISNC